MGKGYNNYMTKKPFHPGSKANIKRTWMAEQRTENEKRKQEELKLQYEKEQDLYNNRALLSTDSKDKLELNFMYEAPPGAKRERQKEDDEPEYKFEWQRKYNAPREDYAKGNAEIRDQPFGIPVRNVRCIKCHKWGHVNTDKECPLFNSASASSMPTTSMDPLELMRQMREDGYDLKQNVLGHHMNPAQSNQQFVHSDESDPEMEFLKSLTPKQKKKLLKKLNKLSKKQKKKDEAKKKKKHEAKAKAIKDSSDSESDEKPIGRNKSRSDGKFVKESGNSDSNEDSEENAVEHFPSLNKKHKKDRVDGKSKNALSSSRSREVSKTGKKKSTEDHPQDGSDATKTGKSKKDHHHGDEKDKDQSVDGKCKLSQEDLCNKSHKNKRRESKRLGGSGHESSEDDEKRGCENKRSPETNVGERHKRKKDHDRSKEQDSSPIKKSKTQRDGSCESNEESPKKKDEGDLKKSNLKSSPRIVKKKHADDKSGGDSTDKKQKEEGHSLKDGDCPRSCLQQVSVKRQPKGDQKTVHESSVEEEKGASDESAVPALPKVKFEKKVEFPKDKGDESVCIKDTKQVHGGEDTNDAKPSTSKQVESSSSEESEDEDAGKFAKPLKSAKSGKLKKKSTLASTESPEHPDGFSHRHPQRKRSGKEFLDVIPEEPKYVGYNHDRFRDLHRHRRSPSIKHKYHR